MLYLLAASLIWAFSFGLIQHKLVGAGLDVFFVAFLRLALSALAFAPLLRVHNLRPLRIVQLTALGALQYGVMYMAYMQSYHYLASHEVALFTIVTPLYVVLIHDALTRRMDGRSLLAATAAVIGTGVLVWTRPLQGAALAGIGLLQVANLCFAFGQVLYGRVMGAAEREAAAGGVPPPTDYGVFALLYVGATAVALLPAVLRGVGAGAHVGAAQVLTLLYLGLLPSALGFYLWNAGARRTGVGVLAAMNNAKVPLAMLVSLLVFGEEADGVRLAVGATMLIAAVTWGARSSKRDAQSLHRKAV